MRVLVRPAPNLAGGCRTAFKTHRYLWLSALTEGKAGSSTGRYDDARSAYRLPGVGRQDPEEPACVKTGFS